MEDLFSSACRVAKLTLAVAVGRLGTPVLAELADLLPHVPEGHRRCVAIWSDNEQLSAATGILLSQQNLDQLRQLGFQLPAQQLGQPLRLHVMVAIDAGDPAAASSLEKIMDQLSGVPVRRHLTALVLHANTLDDCLSADATRKVRWDVVLPFPAMESSVGRRSEADLVSSVARTMLLLSLPASGVPGSATQLSASEGARVLRVGGAFVDARLDDLLKGLGRRVVGRLLRLQFEKPKSLPSPSAYDEDARTNVEAMLTPERLATALVASTPFVLETRQDGAWRLSLPAGETAVELHGLPRHRWVAVLRKLKDFFEFSKARRWREQLESAEEDLLASLKVEMAKDVAALHRYPRGPDRVLTWCDRLRARLEAPFELARHRGRDFEQAAAALRHEVAAAPEAGPLWACAASLGLLAGSAARASGVHVYGFAGGVVGLLAAIGAAAGLALWAREAAHGRLMRARSAALEALAVHYEQQASTNLTGALLRVREALAATVEDRRRQNLLVANAAVVEAEALERRGDSPCDDGLVNVESALPRDREEEFLASLSLPWQQLVAAAASAGVLVPARADDGQTAAVELAPVERFAQTYLETRRADCTLGQQLAFRARDNAGCVEQLVANLQARAAGLAPGPRAKTTWFGPPDLLDSLGNAIYALDPGAERQPIDVELLACLRVESIAADGGRA